MTVQSTIKQAFMASAPVERASTMASDASSVLRVTFDDASEAAVDDDDDDARIQSAVHG